MHHGRVAHVGLAGLLLAVVGCATVPANYDPPTVTVTSFRPASTEDAALSFLIGLHVTNPNRDPLTLDGIAYTVALEGHEVISGVSRDLPVIEGYSAEDITITANVSLLESLRLVGELMGGRRDELRYALKAKLDVGAFRPAIRVENNGVISLRAPAPSASG
jgi:LEA14-like dessication related protein